jgi:hypothetical protein
MKKIYIRVSSDWVPKFVGTPEDVVDHLKEYYLDTGMLEDWNTNKEKLRIETIEMTEKEFDDLGEWEP